MYYEKMVINKFIETLSKWQILSLCITIKYCAFEVEIWMNQQINWLTNNEFTINGDSATIISSSITDITNVVSSNRYSKI